MSDLVPRLNEALEGRYRIERELGAGGMATVYLTEDLRHERKVALKVLKPELAAVVGAERFLTEIKTTANLQHPNILPLFDSGEADGFLFYVMPYVEGESLRDKLTREHQLPVAEAVRIAAEVAEALEAAHEQGVVHRDIKPANILLSRGRPLVADFGIALAVNAAGGGRLTETGLSLGTPHYMSPEQATGDLHVGAPADVYALGCVLYEMLVGEPPYTGSTAQAILGKIITGQPSSATEHRASIPANVDAAIRKSLERLPADRFLRANDFAQALADKGFTHGGEAAAKADDAGGPWKRVAVAASLVAVLALGSLAALVARGPQLLPNPVVRFTIPVGEGEELYLGGAADAAWGRPSVPALALSPRGDVLVYAAWRRLGDGEFEGQLYSRRLDQERADPIAGTEGAYGPFFSPDGTWVGFASGSSLRRLSIVDGNVETIVPDAGVSPTAFQAMWGDDDTIVYLGNGLYRVSATGGEPAMVVPSDQEVFLHPHLLPGSQFLLAVRARSLDAENHELVVVDLDTRSVTPLLEHVSDPRYVESGHLVFLRRGTLMAVGFDPASRELKGEPVVVLEDVLQAEGMPNTDHETWAGQVSMSPAGHLAYARGGIYPPRPRELVRVRFDGAVEPMGLPNRQYGKVRVSPDGERLVFSERAGLGASLSVHDWARRTTEPLATGGFFSDEPVWSPDGRVIAFTSDRVPPGPYRMSADGSGEPERLLPNGEYGRPVGWSFTGVIAYLRDSDIWMQPPDQEAAPFFTSDALESYAAFSPDGRWVAYAANQTGRNEVYVRPFPGPGAATLISQGGGWAPTWSRDGRRLFFLSRPVADPVMMAVDVVPGETLRAGTPSVLIGPWPYNREAPTRAYDVLDDASFIASAWVEGTDFRSLYSVDEVRIVLNFAEELKARVPN